MDIVIPIDEEFTYEDRVCVSQTDMDGKIVYINKAFCTTTAYTKKELIDSTYQIIRHPDMPHIIFEKMWETINDGQTWTGLIKNLRKDGQYFWDDLSVLPIKDENEQVTGFISCARAASRKNIKENEKLYEKMLATEQIKGV